MISDNYSALYTLPVGLPGDLYFFKLPGLIITMHLGLIFLEIASS